MINLKTVANLPNQSLEDTAGDVPLLTSYV